MVIDNNNFSSGNYNSQLLEYLNDTVNYDGSFLFYNDKYGKLSFTIGKPNLNYKNCEFISSYPHFDIPVEILIKEINDFINNKPIYNDDFIIRYGDIHPNKPYPMLGQTRNIYLGNFLKNMISSTGNVESVFTIGDISEKSVSLFLNNINTNVNVSDFIRFFLNIDCKNKNVRLLNQYGLFCKNSLEKSKKLLFRLGLEKDNYLFESKLYRDTDLFNFIKNMKYEDGLKNNGMLKYFLQEFMFLLNENYKDKCIINIIGSDQSTHIKKVFNVIRDNNIDSNVKFISYGICKNAGSRNINEWESQLNEIIESKKIKIEDNYLEPFDFLKYYYLLTGTDTILDFNNVNNYPNNFLETIVDSINKSSKYSNKKSSIKSSALLGKMALINQQLDVAITSGNPSKLVKYIYDIATEYIKNYECYEDISYLYFEFMNVISKKLTIEDTKPFQKVLKRRNV